jgi:hypothetical protein
MMFLWLLTLSFGLTVTALGQTPTMTLVPDSSITTIDGELDIHLVVDESSVDLKSFSVAIQNDATVIRTTLPEITEGPLLGSAGILTFFWASFSEDLSTIYIDGAILGDGVTVDGGGELAKLHFHANGYGISELEFSSIRARNAENQPLAYDAEGAWVRVCHLLGDVNNDNIVNISDAVYLIAWIFGGGPEPIPDVLAGDTDCSGFTNISDVVAIISYIFGAQPFCQVCFDWP